MTALGSCGRFRLLERIGGGGMAEIFLAHPSASKDPREIYAIKWARPFVAKDKALHETLRDESRITRVLKHSNIARVHGYGEQDKRVYVVMDYIHGKNLRSVQRRAPEVGRPIPYWVSAYVMSRVADALDYAHAAADKNGEALNIIHRDVNPHNVMITYDGIPKLIDFGIAKAEGRMTETQVGQIKGKSAYMSPEQARGLSMDNRTDIYSAGLILYELLTGVQAIRGKDDSEMIHAAANAEFKPPEERNPEIPEVLLGVLRRCLEYKPRKRYETGGQMRRDIKKYLATQSPASPKDVLASFMETFFGDAQHEESLRIRQLLS